MTRSASAQAALALMALLIAGCAQFGSKPVPPPKAPAPAPVVKPAAPKIDHGDPDQRFKAALALMKDKQPQPALAAFASLAKDFPEFSGPLTDLGILDAQSRQPGPAIASLEKAVQANPANAIAANWLGTLYRENKDYPRAEAAYKRALTANADYAAPHLNLGVLYDVYQRRPQEALAQYREYQRLAGTGKLIVTAWIRELEAGAPSPAPTASPPVKPAPTQPPAERP